MNALSRSQPCRELFLIAVIGVRANAVEKDEEKEKGIRGFCHKEGKGFQIVLRKVKKSA